MALGLSVTCKKGGERERENIENNINDEHVIRSGGPSEYGVTGIEYKSDKRWSWRDFLFIYIYIFRGSNWIVENGREREEKKAVSKCPVDMWWASRSLNRNRPLIDNRAFFLPTCFSRFVLLPYPHGTNIRQAHKSSSRNKALISNYSFFSIYIYRGRWTWRRLKWPGARTRAKRPASNSSSGAANSKSLPPRYTEQFIVYP